MTAARSSVAVAVAAVVIVSVSAHFRSCVRW
jgi:hypothetical protein